MNNEMYYENEDYSEYLGEDMGLLLVTDTNFNLLLNELDDDVNSIKNFLYDDIDWGTEYDVEVDDEG